MGLHLHLDDGAPAPTPAPWVDGERVWFGFEYTGGVEAAQTNCPAWVGESFGGDDIADALVGQGQTWGVGLGPNGEVWDTLAAGLARQVGIQAFLPNGDTFDPGTDVAATDEHYWGFPVAMDPVTHEALTTASGTQWDTLDISEIRDGTTLRSGYYQVFDYYFDPYELGN